MANQFGERVRKLRELNRLFQREIAAILNIDIPMLSKIERGERKAKKQQIKIFAKVLKASENELLTLWLADQLEDIIEGEELASQALRSVSKKINTKKRINDFRS